MDAILEVKRTLVLEFNVNLYVDPTLAPNTIKNYYNYNPNANFRSYRSGPFLATRCKMQKEKQTFAIYENPASRSLGAKNCKLKRYVENMRWNVSRCMRKRLTSRRRCVKLYLFFTNFHCISYCFVSYGSVCIYSIFAFANNSRYKMRSTNIC